MITSLHSPHVEVVKALLGSRGVKERRERGLYVIEGEQNLKSALLERPESIERIYYTLDGIARISQIPADIELIEVSPQVMSAMSDTVSPQGILALANISQLSLEELFSQTELKKVAYFWQIQDPGNAGTVIRAANAFGFDAVIFSDNSVDLFSPKVVRASAGSFWRIDLVDGCSATDLIKQSSALEASLFITMANGEIELESAAIAAKNERAIWVFGNEARGVPEEIKGYEQSRTVSIPMPGGTESLNLATAAAVVMYAASKA